MSGLPFDDQRGVLDALSEALRDAQADPEDVPALYDLAVAIGQAVRLTRVVDHPALDRALAAARETLEPHRTRAPEVMRESDEDELLRDLQAALEDEDTESLQLFAAVDALDEHLCAAAALECSPRVVELEQDAVTRIRLYSICAGQLSEAARRFIERHGVAGAAPGGRLWAAIAEAEAYARAAGSLESAAPSPGVLAYIEESSMPEVAIVDPASFGGFAMQAGEGDAPDVPAVLVAAAPDRRWELIAQRPAIRVELVLSREPSDAEVELTVRAGGQTLAVEDRGYGQRAVSLPDGVLECEITVDGRHIRFRVRDD